MAAGSEKDNVYRLVVLTSVALLLALISCGGDGPIAPASESAAGWTRVAGGFTQASLGSVWQSSSGRLYVGSSGGLFLYDGTEWWPFGFPGQGPGYALYGTSDLDVFAGVVNTIQHFDGTSWTQEAMVIALAIWGDGRSEPFAVGNGIYRRNNGVWEKMEVPTTYVLDAIWGASSNDVFAVGAYGRIVHFDGTVWSTVLSDVEKDLRAIGGLSGADVIAAGEGVITHFDGARWSHVDVGGPGTTWRSVFANMGSLYVAGSNGRLLRFRNGTWQEVTGFPGGMNAVSAGSHGAPVAAGSGVFRLDGDQWKSLEDDPRKGYEAVGALSGQRAIVGGTGIGVGEALLYEGSSLQQSFEFPGTVRDIWAGAPDNVDALIGDLPYHFDGTRWTAMGEPGVNGATSIWRLGDGRVMVAGYDTLTAVFDGSAWTAQPLAGVRVTRDFWGPGDASLFVVTDKGVYHFDGSAWSPWAFPGQEWSAIAGSSISDIWLVSWSMLSRYNGFGWVSQPLDARFNAYAVAVRSPDDAYIAGDGIMHWDGFALTRESMPATPHLVDISISPSGSDVWAVGEAGAIFHLDRR